MSNVNNVKKKTNQGQGKHSKFSSTGSRSGTNRPSKGYRKKYRGQGKG